MSENGFNAQVATETETVKRRSAFQNFLDRLRGIQTETAASGESEELKRLPIALRPRTITVMNQKGGCGKTTTVVNLSAALAISGYHVLVVDMDPQAHASLGFGISTQNIKRSIYDVLLNDQISFEHVVCSTGVDHLDLLPSSIRLSTAQLELAHISRGEMVLKRALKELDKSYDFVLIDCPPTLNLLTLNALCYSTQVIIPVQTHYYALEGMKELFKTVNAIRGQFNPDLEILGILATLFDKRIRIAVDMLEALRDYFKDEMFQTVIHHNVKLIEAPMVQKPVVSYAPNSSAALDFQHLAQEVVRLVTKTD